MLPTHATRTTARAAHSGESRARAVLGALAHENASSRSIYWSAGAAAAAGQAGLAVALAAVKNRTRARPVDFVFWDLHMSGTIELLFMPRAPAQHIGAHSSIRSSFHESAFASFYSEEAAWRKHFGSDARSVAWGHGPARAGPWPAGGESRRRV